LQDAYGYNTRACSGQSLANKEASLPQLELLMKHNGSYALSDQTICCMISAIWKNLKWFWSCYHDCYGSWRHDSCEHSGHCSGQRSERFLSSSLGQPPFLSPLISDRLSELLKETSDRASSLLASRPVWELKIITPAAS
jgi:hypothetical protein